MFAKCDVREGKAVERVVGLAVGYVLGLGGLRERERNVRCVEGCFCGGGKSTWMGGARGGWDA